MLLLNSCRTVFRAKYVFDTLVEWPTASPVAASTNTSISLTVLPKRSTILGEILTIISATSMMMGRETRTNFFFCTNTTSPTAATSASSEILDTVITITMNPKSAETTSTPRATQFLIPNTMLTSIGRTSTRY